MENHCTPRCMAVKLLILGLILVLAELYTSWDMWIVFGVILIIKAIVMFIMPVCPCNAGKRK